MASTKYLAQSDLVWKNILNVIEFECILNIIECLIDANKFQSIQTGDQVFTIELLNIVLLLVGWSWTRPAAEKTQQQQQQIKQQKQKQKANKNAPKSIDKPKKLFIKIQLNCEFKSNHRILLYIYFKTVGKHVCGLRA